jgi:uncharacterized peroxidase-related enzyme
MALDAATLPPASWLRLGDTPPASPHTEAIFAATRDAIGYVRHQQRVLAHKPGLLAAVTALGDAIVRDADGVLSPREPEVIALVVSAENRCEPCVFGHAAALRGQSGDAEWVATIEVNYRRATLTSRERALADYALKLTRAGRDRACRSADAARRERAGSGHPGGGGGRGLFQFQQPAEQRPGHSRQRRSGGGQPVSVLLSRRAALSALGGVVSVAAYGAAYGVAYGGAARGTTPVLRLGDQKGGLEALLRAAGQLDGLPYRIEIA